MKNIGIVIIGRNEGRRLLNCLDRLKENYQHIVYVDSGSTDSSVEFARSANIAIIELDKHIPFTAARSRNEGSYHLLTNYPELKYLQFIDGDCELLNGWLEHARQELEGHPERAIVFGQVTERHPEKSIYNLLCDIEWNIRIGQTRASGGIFMIRAKLFKQIKGFNPSIIAGEELELGYRIRNRGFQIWRIDYPMAIHDADITKFSQWWKRCVRNGFANAQNFALHGLGREKFRMRENMRIWLWVILIPLCVILAANIFSPAFFACFLIYPLQIIRVMIMQYQKNNDWKLSFYYSLFNLIGKLPELKGQIQFILCRALNKQPEIIEYK
ncbi:MAG: glycosyltransferase family 2 protein [Deltaproteobacteria bacterium]|nr:glycosyltransferase family 2 protein [Deltaproteobacteria bacterium]